jgi:hypothetical protein
MTTFQDPPYQSRRAVRQSGHVDDVEVDAPVRPATSRTGRRAQLPSSTEWAADDSSAAGTESLTAPAPAEPLTLATPLQPQMPVYDAPVTSVVSDDAVSDSPSTPVAPPAPQGRRASLGTGERHPATSVITAITDAPVSSDAASTHDVTADAVAAETTPVEAAPVEPAAEAIPADVVPIEPAPVEVAPVSPEPSADRPMTRRELREARVAAERAAERAAGTSERSTGTDEVPEAIVSILNSGPIILPYLSSPATAPLSPEDRAAAPSARAERALAEFEALTSEHEGDAAPIGADEHPAAPASTWAMPLEPSSVSEVDTDADALQSTDSVADEPADVISDLVMDVDADNDDDVIDASDHVAPAPIVVPEFVEPGQTPVSNRGAGHWSVSPDTDTEIESLENSVTRSVGVGSALTTSALVLPSIPQSSDRNSPYTATGETMLTGSIDLPRSLGSTGVHPSQVDNSDFDLDPLDHEVPSTDSAPVRAIRAVSTHTSSNGLITSKKPQGNHMLTVLVVSSSALAVVVVGLLVAGVSSGLFQ